MTTRSASAKQDDASHKLKGNVTARSAFTEQNYPPYMPRTYNMDASSDPTRQGSACTRGTSSPRLRHRHHAPLYENYNLTDEEDFESEDNRSSHNEQRDEKAQKKLKHKKESRLTAKATKATSVQSSITSKQSNVTSKQLDITSKQLNIIIIVCAISVVIIILGLFLWCSDYPSLAERKSQLTDTFIEIRKQFPTQEDDLWLTLFAGIKDVEEKDPSQPSTFLLLHEVEEDETPKCLAVKMSKAATAFLEARDPSPLKLRGEELGANDALIEDHGVLICELKENITNHRAMIIFNLHKIPATVAQSFHYFCDEYNPVVGKAVYFFTMSVTKKLHSRNNPTYVAESELKKLWQQQLENDKLQPLIVRLTTSVIMIKPEKGLDSCDS